LSLVICLIQRKASLSFGDDGDFDRLGKRVQSLDWTHKPVAKPPQMLKPSTQIQKDQEEKSKEAHAYRQKLLEEQKKKHEVEVGIMSPGYKREKETIRLKKAQQTERTSDGRNATFSECTFNMANILMVRTWQPCVA
jgi:hypothetical protein